MRTAPVQVICRGCSVPYRTTVRGSSTRCARCGVQRYVRRAQQWEGPRDLPAADHPALARPPVWCDCGRCGHEWESLAADGSSIRCPDCRHSVRVPRRAAPAPPPPRRLPAPRAPARPPRRPPAVHWPRLFPARQFSSPAPGSSPARRPAPPPPPPVEPPRPASTQPATWPRPAGPARSGAVTALYGHPIVPPAQHVPGQCALLRRPGEPCRYRAELAVTIGGHQWDLCTGHTESVDRQRTLGAEPPLSR